MQNSNRFRLNGLLPATFTPLHADGSLNLAVVEPMVEHLIRDGVTGLYVCGSTGEGVSLAREERMAAAEAFIAAARRRIPVVVQIGHNSIAEARLLAAHAQSAGAAAISATPPSYFKPPTLAALVDSMAEIAAAAPNLPFYYYHIPLMTGVTTNVAALLRAGGEKIPTLAGVKFSYSAVFDLQAAAAVEDGRYNLLFGSDEMLLSGLCAGAHGAVGTTYNFAAPLFNRIVAAYTACDLPTAQRLQAHAVEMINLILGYGGVGGVQGRHVLLRPRLRPRAPPPGRPHPPRSSSPSARTSTAIGFFDWARGTE